MRASDTIQLKTPLGDSWAYLAGLFDGEGSINVSRGTIRLRINMTSEETLRHLEATFGGKLHRRPAPASPRHKQQWTWSVERQADMRFMLNRLLPLLVTKRRQADLALHYLTMARWLPTDAEARVEALEAMRGMND